ncbi:MAG: ATP-binding cassette domain-containing protein [Planctomycetales bacterium]|nr:ATP-binding cassette domain-containing protein [Planctomycetales bacterium]
MDSPPLVVAQGLCKTFRGKKRTTVEAVREVSFTAHAGEIFGLLGPNGAGKTTTLRMLSTALRPTAGTATIAGHDLVRQPAEVRRRIGFLSASTGLYGRLTPREVVTYFGRLAGVPPGSLGERVTELFARLGIAGYADRRCDSLSTGQKQRVTIARAVVHDPPVVVMDEPTAGLDVLGARAIVDFVAECRARGRCVLLSTHVMHEAQKLCDRVAVIHEGRLLAEGTPAELCARLAAPDLEAAFVKLVGGAAA